MGLERGLSTIFLAIFTCQYLTLASSVENIVASQSDSTQLSIQCSGYDFWTSQRSVCCSWRKSGELRPSLPWIQSGTPIKFGRVQWLPWRAFDRLYIFWNLLPWGWQDKEQMDGSSPHPVKFDSVMHSFSSSEMTEHSWKFVAKSKVLIGYHALLSPIAVRIFVKLLNGVVGIPLIIAALLSHIANDIYSRIGTSVVSLRRNAALITTFAILHPCHRLCMLNHSTHKWLSWSLAS